MFGLLNLSTWGTRYQKNPAFCLYLCGGAAPRHHLQALGEETADGEVKQVRTKRWLFLRRRLSDTTMSHSSVPWWALINSNFTFWPTSLHPSPLALLAFFPLRCPPDPAINASCQMTSTSIHVYNSAWLPLFLRKTSHFSSSPLDSFYSPLPKWDFRLMRLYNFSRTPGWVVVSAWPPKV